MAGPVHPFWPPHVAGTVLGLVAILTFIPAGIGVRASGLFARIAAALGMELTPEATLQKAYLSIMLRKGANSLTSRIVAEIAGIAVGAPLAPFSTGRQTECLYDSQPLDKEIISMRNNSHPRHSRKHPRLLTTSLSALATGLTGMAPLLEPIVSAVVPAAVARPSDRRRLCDG